MERNRQIQSEQYPYAHPVTFEFLKTAISEGAQIEPPAAFVKGKKNAYGKFLKGNPKIPRGIDITAINSLEDYASVLWVRMRNIAGAFYSSWAALEDIGKQYGFKNSDKPDRERPRQLINEFIECLWENCSEETRKRFPLEKLLNLKNPKNYRQQREYEHQLNTILLLSQLGRNAQEIGQLTIIPITSVIRIIKRERKAGRLGPSNHELTCRFNNWLKKVLSNPPKDPPVLRQGLLNSVSFTFFNHHRGYFVSLTKCSRLAGRKKSPNRDMENVINILKRGKIPFREFRGKSVESKGQMYIKRYFVILPFDLDRTIDAIRRAGKKK